MLAPTPFFADRGCHVRILEEARAVIPLGARPGEISEPTPLAEITVDDAPRLEPQRPPEGAAAQALERLRSLRHYLPFFGRKRG